MHPKFYFSYWNQKQFFSFFTVLNANATIKGCLTASTGMCFITVGRIEWTSKNSRELWDQLVLNASFLIWISFNCSCNLRIKSPFLYFLSSTLWRSCGILKSLSLKSVKSIVICGLHVSICASLDDMLNNGKLVCGLGLNIAGWNNHLIEPMKSWIFILNPFTPKISLVILITVCYTTLMMLVLRF